MFSRCFHLSISRLLQRRSQSVTDIILRRLCKKPSLRSRRWWKTLAGLAVLLGSCFRRNDDIGFLAQSLRRIVSAVWRPPKFPPVALTLHTPPTVALHGYLIHGSTSIGERLQDSSTNLLKGRMRFFGAVFIAVLVSGFASEVWAETYSEDFNIYEAAKELNGIDLEGVIKPKSPKYYGKETPINKAVTQGSHKFEVTFGGAITRTCPGRVVWFFGETQVAADKTHKTGFPGGRGCSPKTSYTYEFSSARSSARPHQIQVKIYPFGNPLPNRPPAIFTWNITVAEENPNAPTARREEPSTRALSLNIGQSQNFEVRCTDADSDIDYAEILTAGAPISKDHCFFFCGSQSASRSFRWSSAGIKTVTGQCVDDSEHRDLVTWQVTVGTPPPDLVVESPTVSDSTLTSGQEFTLSARVRNQGSASSARTALRYYRSTNPSISTHDTWVDRTLVSTLSSDRSSSERVDLTAPRSAGTYYYGACVESVAGESNTNNNCSTGVSVTVNNPTPSTPSAPTNVRASNETYSDKIRISWNRVSSASSYRIYRSSRSNSGYSEIGTVSRSPYDDTLATAGTTYYYTLKACTGARGRGTCSDLSNYNSGQRSTPSPTPPPAITLSTPTPLYPIGSLSSPTEISTLTPLFSWNRVANANAYQIYISKFPYGSSNLVHTSLRISSTESSYALPSNTLENGVAYGWNMRAFINSPSTQSGFSTRFYFNVNLPDTTTAPRTPTNVRASDGEHSDKIRISWNHVSSASSYSIYRSSRSNSGYSVIGTISGSPYDDTLATAGTTYYYKLKACTGAGGGGTCGDLSGYNSGYKSQQSSSAPDLIVESPTVSDATLTSGQEFTLSARVRNQGSASSARTTLRYYRSSDSSISTSDTSVDSDPVSTLSSNRSSSERVDLTAPRSAGTYYYGACVESVTGESNTNNNCSTGVRVTVSEPSRQGGICDRTPQVRDEIVRELKRSDLKRLSSDENCADVSSSDLRRITSLFLSEDEISSLREYDFDGLSSLTRLSLYSNQLTSLPAGVFNGLSSLTRLDLYSNQLTTLPAGVFSELSLLTSLNLRENKLTTLPANVFNELSLLTSLDLDENKLSTLPTGAFNGLSSLTRLDLDGNQLTTLPTGAFNGLSSLTRLDLEEQQLVTISARAFNGLSSLTRLDLNDNQLTTLPAGAFNGLSSLTELDLRDNQLTTLQTGAFNGLSSLTDLNLFGNRLTTLQTGAFNGLSSLTDLNLNEQQLVTISVGAFNGLSRLEALSLESNQLTTLPMGLFNNLSSLTSLDLEEQQLVTISAGAFNGLSSLTSLDLEENQLTTLPTGAFNGLSSLTSLDLRNNQLTTLPTGAFNGLSSLTSLDLEEQQLVIISAGAFNGLSSLTSLDLESNQLTTLSTGIFNDLSSLTSLNLEENQLTTLPANVFNGLSSLTSLWLSRNQLTTLPAGVFNGLSSLTDLYLRSNQLTTLPAGIFAGLSSVDIRLGSGVRIAPSPLTLTPSLSSISENGGVSRITATLDTPSNTLTRIMVSATAVPPAVATDFTLSGTTLTIAAGATTSTSVVTLTAVDNNVVAADKTITISATVIEGDGASAPSDLTLTITNDDAPVTVADTAPRFAADEADIQTYSYVEGAGIVLTLPEAIGGNGSLTYTLTPDLPAGLIFNPVTRTISGTATVTNMLHTYTYTVTDSDSNTDARDSATLTYVVIVTSSTAGICTRTTAVHEAIVAQTSGISDCADITDSHLAAIGTLNLSNKRISSLQSGDFDGLSSLTSLYLGNNQQLTTLPANVFSGLSSLTELGLGGNRLTLPVDVFNGLSSLIVLYLDNNQLITIPANVFNGLSSLTKLSLHNNQLTTIPTGVFNVLSSLTELYLSRNQLTTIPANVFNGLSSLTELYLYNNQLTTLPADVFSGLSSLTELDLDGNQLTILPENVFNDLSSLTELYLYDNQLTTLPTGAFNGLSSLTELYLYDNQLTTLPTGAFNGLSSLTRLSLYNNQLIIIPANVFNDLSSLTELYLYDNQLTTLPTGAFNGLSSLTRLSLSGNQLTTIQAGAFNGLSSLTELYLYDNQLTTLPTGAFNGLSSLTRLSLYNNQLITIPANVFNDLSSLAELYLYDNQLTTLPTGAFNGLSRLAELYLGGNQLTTLPTGAFNGLFSLTRLSLYNNQLTTLPANVFNGLSSLIVLYLENNQLTTLPTGAFNGLFRLAELYLEGNQLTTLPMDVFNGLSSLTDLYLGSNQLTTLPAGIFAGLPLSVDIRLDSVVYIAPLSLTLSPSSISENGGISRITATLDTPSSTLTRIMVSATAVSPAVATDFTLSGTTLTIATGATTSTGLVTLTAVDNNVDAADKTITISATVSGNRVNAPSDLTLTITDDDAPGTVADTAPRFAADEADIQTYSYVEGAGIVLTLPEAIGGNGSLTYALTPDLPAGLIFNPVTRTISGTATVTNMLHTYTNGRRI